MRVIDPLEIQNGMLNSSTVAENDETEWDSASVPYADGDVVMVTTTANGASEVTHKIYTSTAGSNNEDPTERTTYVDGDGNTVFWWTEDSSTNRWKMFDTVIQDQTSKSGGFEVVVEPGMIVNGLAFMNVTAESIDVVVDDPTDGEVYNESFSLLNDDGIDNWWDYFFAPIDRDTKLAIFDLPAYTDAVITATINATGTAAVGAMVLGTYAEIGDSLYGAGFSITDYSTKEVDADGRATIELKGYIDEQNVDVKIETSRFGYIKRLLTGLRSQPTVWVADADRRETIVYGYYRDFDIIISGPVVSDCTLEIEGLL